MSVAGELHTSLKAMGFVQLLLAIVFLGCYSVACSTLFESRGRARAGVVALLAAVAFTALTQPWVHGALMVAGAVAGLGLFSAISWALSSALHVRQVKLPVLADDTAAVLTETAAEPAVEPVASPAPARVPQHTRIPAA
jgi:O-antigen/teichoic acid export membrane protein